MASQNHGHITKAEQRALNQQEKWDQPRNRPLMVRPEKDHWINSRSAFVMRPRPSPTLPHRGFRQWIGFHAAHSARIFEVCHRCYCLGTSLAQAETALLRKRCPHPSLKLHRRPLRRGVGLGPGMVLALPNGSGKRAISVEGTRPGHAIRHTCSTRCPTGPSPALLVRGTWGWDRAAGTWHTTALWFRP